MSITKRLTLVIVYLFMLSTAFAEDAKDDAKVYPIYDDVQLVSTLNIQYDKPRIVVKAVYPQLESDSSHESVDDFNQLVLDLMKEKMSEFKTNVIENASAQKQLPKYQQKNDLYLDFAASFLQSGKNPLISIRFAIQGYIAGMAHPYHHHAVLNYDLKNNESMTLEDLFQSDSDYLTVLSRYTNMVLQKSLRDKSMINGGTAPTEENFKNWSLKPNGLLITFDEAQVAPYVDGAQTVLVPYAILKDIIDKDSPIASCVINKKRCSRGNVLTGGFIDEAINLRSINPNHRLLNPTLSKL